MYPERSNLTWPNRVINTTTCQDLDLLAQEGYSNQECEKIQTLGPTCGCSGLNHICSCLCANGKNILNQDDIPPGTDNLTCRYIDEVYLQSSNDESICVTPQETLIDSCFCET